MMVENLVESLNRAMEPIKGSYNDVEKCERNWR